MDTTLSLSTPARHIIESYLHLPFSSHRIHCPYFNNKAARLRGALPVSVGKGSPADIVEEGTILAKRAGLVLSNLSEESLRHFLIDHHLGVDCSGLAYHILDAEIRARKNKSLRQYLSFSGGILRRILANLHPVKHTNVSLLADDRNSHEVPLLSIRPGDLIIMLGSTGYTDRDHVLIITRVDLTDTGVPHLVHYVHSRIWKTDTLHTQGVCEGVIDIRDPEAVLLSQTWTERSQVDTNNETYTKAKSARSIALRRLPALDSA